MAAVELLICPENDPLGTPIETFTEEDILDLKLEISLYDLGRNSFRISRRKWEQSALKAQQDGAYYVRVNVPHIRATGAFWGFWLVAGEFVLTSVDEKGGEDVTIGGPGPMWYLTKARLPYDEWIPHTGVYVQEGTWHFSGKNYGQILDVLVAEDAASDYPALTELDTPGWNHTNDVDGNPWQDFPGIYSVATGTDYLSVIRDLQRADYLYAWVTPGSLNLKAFVSYGTDHSGTAFGSGVVRFERGVNIIGNLTRRNEKGQAYTHVLAVGTDKRVDGEVIEDKPIHRWVVSDDYSPGDAIRQGYLTYDTNNLAILERAAKRYMRRSIDRTARLIRAEVMPGTDESNGLYLPGDATTDNGKYWIGDTVTFDTGSGNDLDLVDADLVVAKIELQLGEAVIDDNGEGEERSWRIFIETGDDGRPSATADSSLNTGAKAGVNCRCLRLCDSHVGATEATVEAFFTSETETTTPTHWNGLSVNQSGGADGTPFYYFKSNGPNATQDTDVFSAAEGVDYYVTGYVKSMGSGESFKFGFYDGVSPTPIDIHMLYEADVDGIVTSTWTAFSKGPFTCPAGANFWALGRVGAIDFDQVMVTSGSPVAEQNPLSGTGQDAARCDHAHAYISADADPSIDDDSGSGFPTGTIWVNVDSGQVFISIDDTDGAAVWISVGTGGDHSHTEFLFNTGGGKDVVNTVAAAGSTETLDLADGNVHDVTLTADCTISLTGATNGVGCTMAILLRQGSGAPWDVTWPGSVSWVGGSAPTLEDAEDEWNWIYLTTLDGGTTWFGEAAQASGGSAVDVSDGSTIVSPASLIEFASADFDVTDAGGGEADVNIAPPTSITPTQLTANTDDWNPTGLTGADIIRASTDASRNLTGIAAPPTARIILLENVGTFDLVLIHNATSTAANRFLCPDDANLTLPRDTGCFLAYDTSSNRWRVVGGTGGASATALNDLTDVVLDTPIEGDLLRHNGSEWVNTPAEDTGHYEVLMASGDADPMETSDGLDWLYVWVSG